MCRSALVSFGVVWFGLVFSGTCWSRQVEVYFNGPQILETLDLPWVDVVCMTCICRSSGVAPLFQLIDACVDELRRLVVGYVCSRVLNQHICVLLQPMPDIPRLQFLLDTLNPPRDGIQLSSFW